MSMSLDKKKIIIYQLDLSTFTRSEIKKSFGLLNNREKLYATKFFKSEDRVRFILTRGFCRIILSQYCPVPPEKIRFYKNRYGKPYVKLKNLHFSISHSKKLLVVAVARNEIGIDIEYINPKFEYSGVVDFALSKKEAEILQKIPNALRLPKFFEYWTQKESTLKLTGLGLSFNPTKVEVQDGKAIFSGEKNLANIYVRPLSLHNTDFVGNIAYFEKDFQELIITTLSLNPRVEYNVLIFENKVKDCRDVKKPSLLK